MSIFEASVVIAAFAVAGLLISFVVGETISFVVEKLSTKTVASKVGKASKASKAPAVIFDEVSPVSTRKTNALLALVRGDKGNVTTLQTPSR